MPIESYAKINLMCVWRRKFAVTSDSHHERKVYSNLASQMVVTDETNCGLRISPTSACRTSLCFWR